jgi:DNA processing protein
MDEPLALIALSRTKGLQRSVKRALLDTFGSAALLFDKKCPVTNAEIAARLKTFNEFTAIEKELVELDRKRVEVLVLGQPGYPTLLSSLHDAPLILFKKGPMPIPESVLSIVGSRKATYEGLRIAETVAETISSIGIAVASGLARGIDGSAHKGAVRQKGGTIAVLGSGIDVCYPAENRRLFEEIAERGALVTEYGLGQKPIPPNFPERNRIIAGLAKGVLVVEAATKSGSLITARLALEYGREVMALPGRIFDEAYQGANRLIKQGAKLVGGTEDIMEACFPDFVRPDKAIGDSIDLNEQQHYIYALLGSGKAHVDELVQQSSMETRKVLATLTELEMKDMITPFPGGFYMRKV